ncbi:MAG: hypothetical protein DWQ20_00790 [Actinobacteria bacterium]|nr:MAG: hypothetical protein DWQ20_00790 [Actinomycetota bacterium]
MDHWDQMHEQALRQIINTFAPAFDAWGISLLSGKSYEDLVRDSLRLQLFEKVARIGRHDVSLAIRKWTDAELTMVARDLAPPPKEPEEEL